MSAVRNEQAKLTANYLNGVAIALFAVGGLAQALSILNGDRGPTPLGLVAIGICIMGSTILHFIARRILRGLEP